MGKNMADFLKKLGTDGHLKEKIENKETPDVVDADHSTHPVTEAQCPKCKNEEAYWWAKQTRASDEPETKFLKCTKCGNTWRDAS